MQINRNISKPIYKQLIDSILNDIRVGNLKPNDKLPTERELSKELGISRGTVKKVYKDLADNGVLEVIQGSGTYVSHHNTIDTNNHRHEIAVGLIDELLVKLDKLGFSIPEMFNLMKISLANKDHSQSPLRIAIIDCNAESLEIFKRQLIYHSNISISVFLVETILLDDNPQALLKDYNLILTTITHYSQIEEHLGSLKSRLVRVAVSPSLDTIANISRLPSNSSIGVFCRTNKFSQIIIDQLQCFQLQFKSIIIRFESSLKETDKDVAFFHKYDAIIIDPNSILLLQPELAPLLKQYVSDGGVVIPFNYTIDNGSLAYIEERISNVLKLNGIQDN